MMTGGAKQLALLLACLELTLGQNFTARCGDCWCIPDSGESCPDYPEGITDDSLPQTVANLYESFILVSRPIALEDIHDRRNCYPFADSVGPLDGYPESKFPQCEKPDPMDAVCTLQYTKAASSPESCPDRRYGMFSYLSQPQAESFGAIVTHGGACGVCSNLHDFAMMNKFAKNLNLVSRSCLESYQQEGQDFSRLVTCFQDQIGFTSECSRLWAHYAVTNSLLCDDANGACTGQESSGDPPDCALPDCLQCAHSQLDADFELLAGRTFRNSGITRPLARPCRDFVPVKHDPCKGNATFEEPKPPVTNPNAGMRVSPGVLVVIAIVAFCIPAICCYYYFCFRRSRREQPYVVSDDSDIYNTYN